MNIANRILWINPIHKLWVCQNRKPLSKSNVIQSEAKNLEYIK